MLISKHLMYQLASDAAKNIIKSSTTTDSEEFRKTFVEYLQKNEPRLVEYVKKFANISDAECEKLRAADEERDVGMMRMREEYFLQETEGDY